VLLIKTLFAFALQSLISPLRSGVVFYRRETAAEVNYIYTFRNVNLLTVKLKVAEGHGIMVPPPGTNSGILELDSRHKQVLSAVIV
jgi:hypothetical protein